jgi:hypothetical protein
MIPRLPFAGSTLCSRDREYVRRGAVSDPVSDPVSLGTERSRGEACVTERMQGMAVASAVCQSPDTRW